MPKDSLGKAYEQLAATMSDAEAVTWLQMIELDGYRTSIKVALFKAIQRLGTTETP